MMAKRLRWHFLFPSFLLLIGCLFLALNVVSALNQSRAEDQTSREFRECKDCPLMVAIPAGHFVMGSPTTEHGHFDAEGPQHPVSVKAFALGKYTVTTVEFLTFLRETGYQPQPCNPTLDLSWKSPGHGLAYAPALAQPSLWPATCLSWDDAQAYIDWLNKKVRALPSAASSRDGPYRLPTEAEWEYAARGGTITARWWGDAIGTNKANCNACGSRWDGRLLAPAGSFGPNPFGLYDVLGNVWQWTSDCWNDSYVGSPRDGSSWTGGDCNKRVLRGGSWSNVPLFIRSAMRIGANQTGLDYDYATYAGFRIARNLP
jgi:formylglycine-generating enzyme required for sulfatase activity